LGVGEEVSYVVVGVDGYFVDGNLAYFRVGDFVSVRGVVGSSSANVVGAPLFLKIFDPSALVLSLFDAIPFGFFFCFIKFFITCDDFCIT
jgi:hypothetical protein